MYMENKSKVGKIGELLWIREFGGKQLDDAFDQECDVFLDDKKIEIKTQVRFYKENAFTVDKNQLQKCLGWPKLKKGFGAQFLHFVEYDLCTPIITFWECSDRFDYRELSNGRIAWDISKMTKIKEIQDVESSMQLQQNTSSRYRAN